MKLSYFGIKASPHLSFTPEGFLVCHSCPIARSGIQKYSREELLEAFKENLSVFSKAKRDEEGFLVRRDDQEVFSPETLASFEGKPVTNEHPANFVDINNFSRYACGHVSNVRRGEGDFKGFIVADLIITDGNLIKEISDGKIELSCGYMNEIIFDENDRVFFQKNIRGNHVAIVNAGRAGHSVAIRDKKNTEGKDMEEQEEKQEKEEKISEQAELKKEEDEMAGGESLPLSFLEEIREKLEKILAILQPEKEDEYESLQAELEKEATEDEEEKNSEEPCRDERRTIDKNTVVKILEESKNLEKNARCAIAKILKKHMKSSSDSNNYGRLIAVGDAKQSQTLGEACRALHPKYKEGRF